MNEQETDFSIGFPYDVQGVDVDLVHDRLQQEWRDDVIDGYRENAYVDWLNAERTAVADDADAAC